MKPCKPGAHAAEAGGILLLIAALLFALPASLTPLQSIVPVSATLKPPSLLIDPGHGGADGGAVAPDGSAEKDYNLAISLTLRDMLIFCGYDVSLTRDADVSIHDDAAATLRQQKISDMHNRLSLYDAADVVLSIHQNKFPQRSCRGTQFFYAPGNPASQPLAAAMRDTLCALLQPDNTRELKAGTSDIYLLHETRSPAVLVECGFLSNPEERLLLQRPDYRQKLAYALTCGVLTYSP